MHEHKERHRSSASRPERRDSISSASELPPVSSGRDERLIGAERFPRKGDDEFIDEPGPGTSGTRDDTSAVDDTE
jgi:hypothetical protein